MKRFLFVSVCAAAIACMFLLPAGSARTVTFSKDVAPIFYKSCAECHRPGEVAPMSLLTYKESRPWAKSIREKVVSREMPPWHADPNHGVWSNDRSLSAKEVETITAWVDAGAPEGNPKDMPALPKFVEGWTIGAPDETFSIPEQSVPAEGVVAYQYFTVPTNFKEDRWISAAEIRSTGRSAVHHVIVFVQEPGSGGGGANGNLLAGTAPGEQPTVFEPGYGKKIPAGSKLVFQMHYTPNGVAAKDVTTIGLVYSKQPVKHQVHTRPILNMRFVIPAGDPNHEVRSSYVFQEDAHIVSFMPHMHLRGKSFVYKATFPDGREQVLLSVPRYDFNWQSYYVPKEPIAAPKGTRIDCIAHYDNSAGNKFNPDPTKDVKWGDQTWEEMMIGWTSFYNDASTLKPAPPATTGQGTGK
ncbi:MAG: cytochrome c [Acidobacteria bacterium]|nr:cytochrome c [Acidobacteriota bacterium]MCW5968883.1 cytochrome c [Blastocatellales bacterium]